MKKIITLILFLGNLATFSQSVKSELKVFSFEEVEQLHQQKPKPKPIIVFTYTDWCKICFGMKKNTFQNDEIIKLLNDKFYFINLNREEKKEITFLGKKFVYKPSGNKTGAHELARELASKKGRISYPTTTILNSSFEIEAQIDGYLNSKKFYKFINNYIK
ncbi:thioredoxin family protein [Polaribacter vadi]|uniref:thioredoxin family protein n=1 Tax=Polaribacter vadi TaxID=1774273 RepID=UPI0030EE08A6|tara:strand:+ start:10182 stop:10664 length:483 start_codon:yes stop_codon:yes gene_type:complete